MRTAVALGSNIGERLRNLKTAREQLRTIQRGREPLLCSRVYETEPVDCEPGALPFLNAVVEFEYEGEPAALLAELREIERKLGRPSRRPRNAPRTIDLDILYFGDLAMQTEEITLPHPRIHLRWFVLAPLADIQPGLILPGQRLSVSALLGALPPAQVEVFAETW